MSHDESTTPAPDPTEIDPDTPEADAIEQRQEAIPEADPDPEDLPPDASEADALEQAREVPFTDEDDPAR
jgi:hypothetical protein